MIVSPELVEVGTDTGIQTGLYVPKALSEALMAEFTLPTGRVVKLAELVTAMVVQAVGREPHAIPHILPGSLQDETWLHCREVWGNDSPKELVASVDTWLGEDPYLTGGSRRAVVKGLTLSLQEWDQGNTFDVCSDLMYPDMKIALYVPSDGDPEHPTGILEVGPDSVTAVQQTVAYHAQQFCAGAYRRS